MCHMIQNHIFIVLVELVVQVRVDMQSCLSPQKRLDNSNELSECIRSRLQKLIQKESSFLEFVSHAHLVVRVEVEEAVDTVVVRLEVEEDTVEMEVEEDTVEDQVVVVDTVVVLRVGSEEVEEDIAANAHLDMMEHVVKMVEIVHLDHHVEMMDMLHAHLVVRVEVMDIVDIVVVEEIVLTIHTKEADHEVHKNLQFSVSSLFFREVLLPDFFMPRRLLINKIHDIFETTHRIPWVTQIMSLHLSLRIVVGSLCVLFGIIGIFTPIPF